MAVLLSFSSECQLVNPNKEELQEPDLDWADLVLTGRMQPDTLQVIALAQREVMRLLDRPLLDRSDCVHLEDRALVDQAVDLELRLVSAHPVVDTSLAVVAMPHHRANQRVAAGVLHRALATYRTRL